MLLLRVGVQPAEAQRFSELLLTAAGVEGALEGWPSSHGCSLSTCSSATEITALSLHVVEQRG